MGKKKVTLKQVAELAGVSPATVSMILNRKQLVSFAEETVSRVQLAARTLGYAGIETATPEADEQPRRRNIAVFLPDITGNFYAAMAYAIDFAARTKGYDTVHMVCYRDKERELRALSSMAAYDVAGVVFSYIPHNYELVERISDAMPVVVIGNRDEHMLRLDMVETDSYRAGALLARHMLELGHRHVAFIAPRMEWWGYSSTQRIAGVEDTFRRECPEARLVVKTQVIPGGIDLRNDPRQSRQHLGYTLAEECLLDKSITGFIAVNDYVAYGVVDALHAHGLRIPQDYSVCGCDDVFASALSAINLTTVNHHIKEKCIHAVDILYRKIVALPVAEDASVASTSFTRVEYLSTLMVRGSTARPRGGDSI